MPCFQCPHCGRRHVVRPLDVEDGGRCPCGARFSVTAQGDESEPARAGAEEGTVATWALDEDGSVYEVQFYS